MKKFFKKLFYPFVAIYKWLVWIFWYFFPGVNLSFSADPYFVGSYAKIRVDTWGLSFDDVDFLITEGAPGGYISPCRDAEFDPAHPEIMICFGYSPGEYHVQAIKRSNSSVLNTFTYKLDTRWNDKKNGPSFSFYGINGGYSRGSTWGGGVADQPQNLNSVPASGTRKVALLMVDTASQRYTTNATDLQAIKDRWLENVKNGFVSGGVTRSSKAYYKEVSYNNFDIDCDIFGPVQLSGNYDEYMGDMPSLALDQSCITAGDGVIDYNNYQSVIFVIQHWDTTDAMGNPITKAPWPTAWGNTYTTSEGSKSLGVVQMPHNWTTKPLYATVAHELGHNLGLADVYDGAYNLTYSAAINARTLGDWEMMAYENNIPHFSIAHRLMLGWLQPTWIKLYNFSANGGLPVDETIRLNPIEGTPPGGGNFSGIEIRITDGWNYYIEYRKSQASNIGDRSLPTDNAVLVTDVISSGFTPPITRQGILKVENDSDGDGSVLTNGLDYKETDFSDPTFPTDFKISVNGIDGAKADVRIQYGVNSKPDPSIRPWPASSERQWQSPDIEIQNARNLADPAWSNVPWLGHTNTIIAKIKNSGSLNAPSVRADFFVKNFNVGGAPEHHLGFDTHDINALTTVDFQTEWVPPADGHYCVIVRIPLYQVPTNLSIVEMTELNNMAQSNYDRFISATASPASREISFIEVGNPFSLPTVVFINPNQTNPLYRSYLEHKSLVLEPGERRKIKIMFEYDPQMIYKIPVALNNQTIDAHNRQDLSEPTYGKYRHEPNHARFACFIYNPNDSHKHVIELLGGAEVQVVTGKKTQFESFYKDGNDVRGSVIALDNKQRVIEGKVIVISKKTNGKKEYEDYDTVPLSPNGDFRHKLREDQSSKLLSVQAYYIPASGFGDCYSEVKK